MLPKRDNFSISELLMGSVMATTRRYFKKKQIFRNIHNHFFFFGVVGSSKPVSVSILVVMSCVPVFLLQEIGKL